MNELAIGEIGVIAGVKVQCVKADPLPESCQRCAFWTNYNDSLNCNVAPCFRWERSDHTDVYFKKVD